MKLEEEKTYLAIDLKSFYASVECIERKLDPLNTNLVVADKSRTSKTICLAVSPSLKQYGISSRARLFEVIQAVKEINKNRLKHTSKYKFMGKSYLDSNLQNNKELELDYITATPQMAKYIEYSSKIYGLYLKYFSSDDIHVYSIDEVFIDISHYMSLYKCTPSELATKIAKDIYKTVGITATVGIGTNLFLAKVAMDIIAKHVMPNKDNVRIGYLNEYRFRSLLWDHTPLTDFWRIGPGITRRLNQHGMYTLGDVAVKSIEDEDLLYEIFGINAELIIDHAWGYEPSTIKDIKSYKPVNKSLSIGQVLSEPYDYEKSLVIIKEMADALALDLVKKDLKTNQIVITVMYDIKNNIKEYKGTLAKDYLGRIMPYPSHGTINLDRYISSSRLITSACVHLFNSIIDKKLLTRRFFVVATNVVDSKTIDNDKYTQLNMFIDPNEEINRQNKIERELTKENKLQKTILKIQEKYGKNAILKGTNLLKGGTTKIRNTQIGGHRA